MSRLTDVLRAIDAKGSVTSGRESVKCIDLVKKYPKGIHIDSLEVNDYAGAENYICTFTEDKMKYFYTGKVLTKKFDQIVEEYDGNLSELNADLKESPLLTVLSYKKGKQYSYINAFFVYLEDSGQEAQIDLFDNEETAPF